MVKREHSFLHFPLKPQIFVPSKLGGMSGNGFRFNENFVKRLANYIKGLFGYSLFLLKLKTETENIVAK